MVKGSSQRHPPPGRDPWPQRGEPAVGSTCSCGSGAAPEGRQLGCGAESDAEGPRGTSHRSRVSSLLQEGVQAWSEGGESGRNWSPRPKPQIKVPGAHPRRGWGVGSLTAVAEAARAPSSWERVRRPAAA